MLLWAWAAVLIAVFGAVVNVGVRWAFPEKVGEAREAGGLIRLAR